jgi:hypothetical protein
MGIRVDLVMQKDETFEKYSMLSDSKKILREVVPV